MADLRLWRMLCHIIRPEKRADKGRIPPTRKSQNLDFWLSRPSECVVFQPLGAHNLHKQYQALNFR